MSDADDDRPPGRLRRFLGRLLFVLVLLLGVAVVGGAVAYSSVDVPEAKDVVTSQSTIVFYDDGVTEIGRLGSLNRLDVPLSEVPEHVQHAILAAEDRNFYTEPGISPTGIVRAAWANLRGGEISQGGSTITQQYARNAYLTQERTFARKFQEIILAVKLDRQRSKEQILEDYLNTVYFGRGAYGIQTASETFFHKGVQELTVQEAALLAVQVRAPTRVDPRNDPEGARVRWEQVLTGMVEEGWLSSAEVAVSEYPETMPPREGNRFGGSAGYLLEHVRTELEQQGFDEARLAQGGYRVLSTINQQRQAHAEEAVRSIIGQEAPVVSTDEGDRQLLSPLVSIDPRNGAIVAEFGGRDYVERQFNSATQGRAPAGSAFKPIVLAEALSRGFSVRSTFNGTSPQRFGSDNGYRVSNYGGASYGVLDLVQATANSVNTIYVALAERIGDVEAIKTRAEQLGGIGPEAYGPDTGLSIALGAADVTALQLAETYATFANRGLHIDAHIVTSVSTADGDVVYEAALEGTRVLEEGEAADLTYALQQVVRSGTARGASLGGRPAAGKTGTSQDNKSAWFAGYTPQLVTVVGLFTEGTPTPLSGVAGVSGQVTGGSAPARVWRAYMQDALEGHEVLDFPEPTFGGTGRGNARPRPAQTSDDDDEPRQSSAPSRSGGGGGSTTGEDSDDAPDSGGDGGGTTVEEPAEPPRQAPSPLPPPTFTAPGGGSGGGSGGSGGGSGGGGSGGGTGGGEGQGQGQGQGGLLGGAG